MQRHMKIVRASPEESPTWMGSKYSGIQPKDDPRVAMAEVLQKYLTPSPAWWISLTFRRSNVTVQTAEESLRSWLRQWVRRGLLRGVHRQGPPRIWRLVWCVELQSRGTAHIHALSGPIPAPECPHCSLCFATFGWNYAWPIWRHMKESWYSHHGIARWFPYDDSLAGGVAGYVAKYMYKGPCEHGLWEAGRDF